MNYLLLASTTLLLSIFSFGQSKRKSHLNWGPFKHEFIVSAGATQFLGDLGGRDGIGKIRGLADIDWKSTNWNLQLGYRYNINAVFATTTTLTAGQLSGDDALTNEQYRRARNLHFKSPIIELSQRIELTILSSELLRKGNRARHLRHVRNGDIQLYTFSGLGIVYFNPKAKYQGNWVALRPLRTEGQGLEGGPKKYAPVTATIPVGIGFRIAVSKSIRLGIEATYVKTFSDYIDDVHGVYYDPNKLKDEVGETSAYLSNPSENNPKWFQPGNQRGGKGNDAYFFANFTVAYSLP